MIKWPNKKDDTILLKPSPIELLYNQEQFGKIDKFLYWGYEIPVILNGIKNNNLNIQRLPKKFQIILLDLPYWNDPDIAVESRPESENPGKFLSPNVLAGQPSEYFFNGSIEEYFNLIQLTIKSAIDLLDDEGFFLVKYIGRNRHYLKILIDNIIGIEKFVNEIYINSPFSQRLKSDERINLTKEIFSIILVYSKNEKPKIIPDYKNKKSGGYWHTMHSKGQGDAKIFRLNGKEIKLDPPVGRHWTFSQDKLDKMCLTPHPIEPNAFLIKLNSQGQPQYWILEKEGHILDNIWFDVEAFVWTDLGWELDSPIYDRIYSSFSTTNSSILHIFCGTGNGVQTAIDLNRQYVGLDSRPLAIGLIRHLCWQNKKSVLIGAIGVYQFELTNNQVNQNFRKFIINMIGAHEISNSEIFNGVFQNSLIHISNYDYTFTSTELERCFKEFEEMKSIFESFIIISKDFQIDDKWDEIIERNKRQSSKFKYIKYSKLGKELDLKIQFIEAPIVEVHFEIDQEYIIISIIDFYFMNTDIFSLRNHEYLNKKYFWNKISHWNVEIKNENEIIYSEIISRFEPNDELPLIQKISKTGILRNGKNIVRIEITDICGGIYFLEKQL